MDPDSEVDFDMSPLLIRYKSGRVRRLMGASRADAGTDAATGVTSKDVVIDANADTGAGLAARLFIPTDVLGTHTKLPVVVYFHGGGFVVRSAFSAVYTRFLSALASAARAVAVSVEYRLAPEHPVPAAYDDGWAALSWATAAAAGACGAGRPEEPWLAAHGDAARVFLAGDSAGGNIAHNVALRAGRSGGGSRGGLPSGARIEGLVLLHPYFGGKELVPSEGGGEHPTVRRQTPERVWAFVCAGRYGMDHPFINPAAMAAAGWAALACRRALVTVAERDFMRDRGRRYVEALRGAGGSAVLYETTGEDHIYFLERAGAGRKKEKGGHGDGGHCLLHHGFVGIKQSHIIISSISIRGLPGFSCQALTSNKQSLNVV